MAKKNSSAKAFGFLLIVVALIFGGCNALLGDDKEKKPAAAKARTSATPEPEPTPDQAARVACANFVASSILEEAGRKSRSTLFQTRAIKAAVRSRVPELKAVRKLKRADAVQELWIWCGPHLPDIDADTVDRHLPGFRREHQQIKRSSKNRDGSSGSRDGGGINLPGRW